MRARWSVTAKCVMCLAVAAAGDLSVSAAAIFLMLRVLGAWWAGPELRPRQSETEPFTVRVIVWLRRFEVAAPLAVTAGRMIVGWLVGAALANELMMCGLVAVLTVPQARSRLRERLVTVRQKRRWANSLTAVIPEPATPRLWSYGTDPAGEWAQVRIGPGSTVEDLAGRAGAIAACLAVDTVKVDRHPTNAGWALIRAIRVDPLVQPSPPWPWLSYERTSLWWPIPVGVDETGQPVTVTLAEHNLLLGGEPGAGKSVALSQLVAAAALDPTAGLWLLDGKLVELAAWRHTADGFAGVDINDAIDVLRHVREVMDARYQQLLDAGRRKLEPGSRIEVVVVDELAHYLTWGEKKPRDAFTDTLRDLVSRGRAAGVVVLAATQKPSSDVVPTSLRDLFGYRWALRCTTNAASDTILGSGWATQGTTAATIPPGLRGVGWLLHESGLPVRLRAHHLDDTAIAVLAARAAALRPSKDSSGG